MSFSPTRSMDCRAVLSTCLQCNEYKVSILEVIRSGYPIENNDWRVWECPSCNKVSYVDSLLKPENLVYVCSDSEEEEPDEDEISDGEESKPKALADVDSDVEATKQELSGMALGSPKYGDRNVVSPMADEKSRKRVIPILTGLAEHENSTGFVKRDIGKSELAIRVVVDMAAQRARFSAMESNFG
ncbi:unnamed protein product [Penicillium viridicatum]